MVIATLPAAGTFFTTYEASKTALSGVASGPALHMTSSAIAELASCVILTPAEIIKQRAQVATDSVTRQAPQGQGQGQRQGYGGSGKPFLDEVRKVQHGEKPLSQAAKDGGERVVQRSMAGQVAKDLASQAQAGGTNHSGALSSSSTPKTAPPPPSLSTTFFRGYMALAGRNLPFTAVQFPLYEKFREIFSERWGVQLGSDTQSGRVVHDRERERERDSSASPLSPSPQNQQALDTSAQAQIIRPGLVAATSASLAGSIAALLSTPIDNAKTRIMIGDSSASASKGTIQCMVNIYKNEGWKALWRGGALRSAWTALGAGIYLGSYESGRLWWRTRGARSFSQSTEKEVE